MKYVVALLSILMPVVAWLSNTGVFGPTNGQVSDQYPTLIVAAGYAFSIWGLIFLLDLVYGFWQLSTHAGGNAAVRIRPFTAVAFAMTTLWMIVFSLQLFWLALAIIWLSLICLLYTVWQVSNTRTHGRSAWWLWIPLSLHAGWVTLASFLDIAQVIVAHHLLSTVHMLPWTLVLFALVAILLLLALRCFRGNPWYALAAIWGLAAVYIEQRGSNLAGAPTASLVALALAVLIALFAAGLTLQNGLGSAFSRKSAP